MQSINITTADQQSLAARIYPCDEPKATVVIASALSVPQKFYQAYAEYLNSQGLQCISFDYRGIGESTFHGKLKDIQLIDWGVQDLHAVLEHAFNLASTSGKVLFVGHSIGGQVLGMSEYADKLSAALFIGSSAPYWKRWQGKGKLSMFLNACVLLPFLSQFGEMFPAKKVGLSSMNLPSSIIKQWAGWMRDRDYLFGEKFGYDTSRYGKLEMPIFSYGFDDDHFAPEVNINWLLKFYGNTRIEKKLISSADFGAVGHMGFFKEKFKDSLWKESSDWLLQKIN